MEVVESLSLASQLRQPAGNEDEELTGEVIELEDDVVEEEESGEDDEAEIALSSH